MAIRLGYEDVKGSWVEFLTRWITDANYRMYVSRDQRVFKHSLDDMIAEGFLPCLELFLMIVVDMGVYNPLELAEELGWDVGSIMDVTKRHEITFKDEEVTVYPTVEVSFAEVFDDFHYGSLAGAWKVAPRVRINDWSLVA